MRPVLEPNNRHTVFQAFGTDDLEAVFVQIVAEQVERVERVDEDDKAVLQVRKRRAALHASTVCHALIIAAPPAKLAFSPVLRLDVVNRFLVVLKKYVETDAATVRLKLYGFL